MATKLLLPLLFSLLCMSKGLFLDGDAYIRSIIAGESPMEVEEIVNDEVLMRGIQSAIDDENRKRNDLHM